MGLFVSIVFMGSCNSFSNSSSSKDKNFVGDDSPRKSLLTSSNLSPPPKEEPLQNLKRIKKQKIDFKDISETSSKDGGTTSQANSTCARQKQRPLLKWTSGLQVRAGTLNTQATDEVLSLEETKIRCYILCSNAEQPQLETSKQIPDIIEEGIEGSVKLSLISMKQEKLQTRDLLRDYIQMLTKLSYLLENGYIYSCRAEWWECSNKQFSKKMSISSLVIKNEKRLVSSNKNVINKAHIG